MENVESSQIMFSSQKFFSSGNDAENYNAI